MSMLSEPFMIIRRANNYCVYNIDFISPLLVTCYVDLAAAKMYCALKGSET